MKIHVVQEKILQKVFFGGRLLFDSLGICFRRLLRHICLIQAAPCTVLWLTYLQ